MLVALALILGLAFLPQMWVRGVIKRYETDRPDLPGTGGDFARHILDGMGLQAVRLLPAHMRGRSLSAVVIAAHEVGHAMQDATGYGPLQARTRLAKQAQRIETVGSVVMLAAPVLLVLLKSPHLMIAQVLMGVLILGMGVLMHLVTLPVEFDASFRRALPVLKAGNYVGPADMRASRKILTAAAFTYVAAAALSLLDVMRWFRALKP